MIKTAADLLEAFKIQQDLKLHATGITHPTTIGDMYEGLTAEMQRRTLPCTGLSVVSGFAKDQSGAISKQLDCMLVVGDGEPLPYTDKRVYLLDDIVAVTEVKKTLFTKKLIEAHDNLRSLLDLKPSTGKCILRTVHRAFKNLTGSPVPDDITTLPPLLQQIYHILVVEAGWPARIVLGFRGFANEGTFRQGIVDYLTAKRQVSGSGPMSIPGFIIGPNAAAIKNVAMPWGYPIDRDGTWPLLQTNGCLKPAHVLLEAIWSRLSSLGFVDDEVFGEDLQVEEFNRLVDCRLVPGKGWAFDTFKAKVKPYISGGIKEWSPSFVTSTAYVITLALLKCESVDWVGLQNDPEMRLAIDELRRDGIIGPDLNDPQQMRMILESPLCVRLPDERYAIGENSSGRMERWTKKYFPEQQVVLAI